MLLPPIEEINHAPNSIGQSAEKVSSFFDRSGPPAVQERATIDEYGTTTSSSKMPPLNVGAVSATSTTEEVVPNVEGLDEAIAALDSDGDGFISPAELHVLLLPKAPDLTLEQAANLYATLLTKIDQNGDGQISIPEIKEYWSQKGVDPRSGDVKSQLASVMLSDVRSKISDLFKELSDRVTESPSNSQPPDVEAGVASVAAPAAEAPTVAATPSAQPEAVSVVVESPPKIPAATAGAHQPGDAKTSSPPPGAEPSSPAPPTAPVASTQAPPSQPSQPSQPAPAAASAAKPAQASAPTVATKKKRASSVDAWKELDAMPREKTPFAQKCCFITFFGGCALGLVGGVVVGSIFYFGSNPPL